nr:hypothetical protein [Tanacetum cinerariifolium]
MGSGEGVLGSWDLAVLVSGKRRKNVLLVLAGSTVHCTVFQRDYPDCEVSRALSFCKELHILIFILGIQYPNLID